MTPGVDMVVVSYRSSDHLKAFVESYRQVLDELPTSLTIVTVDATDEEDRFGHELSKSIPRERAQAYHVPLGYNSGYARACNAGAKLGSYDTLLFLNADTELRPGVLTSCHELLWSDSTIGVVGPRQVDLEGRLTHAGIVGTNERPAHRGWMEHDRGQYVDVIDCVTVSGSIYMMKRHVFDELAACPLYREIDPGSEGAFLQSFLYYEETWLSYHARAHDYRVLHNGQATAIHRWHGSIGAAGEGSHFKDSQKLFRAACDHHSIAHD